MAKTLNLKKLPARSVTIFLISAAVIAAVILLVVLPTYRYIGVMDTKIERTRQRIDAEKRLLPLYQELVKRAQTEVQTKLALPERKPMPRGDLDMVPSIMAGLAARSGMEVISASPDVATLSSGSKNVLVNAAIRGNFFSYRRYLVELGKLPFVDRIEEVQIQQKEPEKEYQMKLWVNVS